MITSNEISISVVMPTYNVEEYVEEAIFSVLQQTVKANEIIIVDDGSTDSTPSVLKKFESIKNVTILYTKNYGLGSARNTGASLSSSQFILFVDSDDKLECNLLEEFCKLAQRHNELDLFVYSFKAFDALTGEIVNSKCHYYDSELMGTGSEILVYLLDKNKFHSSSCCIILKANLINWNREGFRNILHEDEEMTPRLFIASNLVYVTPKQLYQYRVNRPNSIMGSVNKRKWLRSRFGYITALISLFKLMYVHRSNQTLNYALVRRAKYLATQAFYPILFVIFVKVKKILNQK